MGGTRPSRHSAADLAHGAVERVVAARHGLAVQLVLGEAVARAEAEVEPPARHDVDERRLLREQRRLAQRGDHDRGADADPLRARRDRWRTGAAA